MNALTKMALLAPLLLTGCFAGSVNPWFSDVERVEEKGIEGHWKQKGEHENTQLVITPLPGRTYRVDMSESDGKDPATRFVVGLARQGKLTWADVQMDRDDAHLKGVEGFVVRPHFAIRAVLQEDTLTLLLVDREWFKQQVEKKRVKLAFMTAASDQEMVLFTAPTAQLTAALKSLEKEPKAFGEPVVFVRVKP